MVQRVNNNTYNLNLIGEFVIHASFNVADLILFNANPDTRVNHLEGKEDDGSPNSTTRDL